MLDCLAHIEAVDPADHLVQGAEAHFRHDLTQLFRHEEEVIDHMLRLSGEARAQCRVLRRHADRTGIEMAFAHHDASRRNQRRGGKAELVSPQQRPDRNVASGAESAVNLHRDTAAQTIEQQRLLRLGKADLPRATRVGERGERRRACTALIARNGDVIGPRLADARRDRTDTDLGNQLHRYPRAGVHILQIMDKLSQILDRIDVMMRRRRNQTHAGRGVPGRADRLVNLVAR